MTVWLSKKTLAEAESANTHPLVISDRCSVKECVKLTLLSGASFEFDVGCEVLTTRGWVAAPVVVTPLGVIVERIKEVEEQNKRNNVWHDVKARRVKKLTANSWLLPGELIEVVRQAEVVSCETSDTGLEEVALKGLNKKSEAKIVCLVCSISCTEHPMPTARPWSSPLFLRSL